MEKKSVTNTKRYFWAFSENEGNRCNSFLFKQRSIFDLECILLHMRKREFCSFERY